jgi:hypothetical protein
MTGIDHNKVGLFRRFSWKPVRFVQLFMFVILVMLLTPVLQKTHLLAALMSIFFLNILLVTLSFAGFDVRRRWPLVLLWFAGTVMKAAALRNPGSPLANMLEVSSDLVTTVLIVACAAMILRFVLASREVTVDTIFGAIVAYFLIAFTFSVIYQALAVVEPSSFSMPNSPDIAGRNAPNIDFAYFSFVTIATLGYGDIVPRLPLAKILSILEAAVGQFYMAVVVAWLVSAYAGGRSASGERSRNGD